MSKICRRSRLGTQGGANAIVQVQRYSDGLIPLRREVSLLFYSSGVHVSYYSDLTVII